MDFSKNFEQYIQVVKQDNATVRAVQDMHGNTLLHQACRRYIDADKYACGTTSVVLKEAREQGRDKCLNDVSFVLSYLENPNTIDKLYGSTALHMACMSGNSLLVEFLLGHEKTDVNSKTDNDLGQTALHLACISGNCDTITLLCKHPKLSLDIEDKKGRTALDIACQLGDFGKNNKKDVIDCLCKLFPRMLKSKWGHSTFIRACHKGDVGLVKQLLSCSDTHRLNLSSMELNDILLASCKPEMIELLFDYSSNTDNPDYKIDYHLFDNNTGETLFHAISKKYNTYGSEYENCMRLLLSDSSFDHNAVDALGNTPLHLACQNELRGVFQLLCEYKKSDPLITNKEGYTVFDIVYQKKDQQLIQLLWQYYPDCYKKWHDEYVKVEDAIECISDIGELLLTEVDKIKNRTLLLKNITCYPAILDQMIKDMSFDLCSNIIIIAAHNNDLSTVKRFMANHYEKRIDDLKAAFGMHKDFFDDHIMCLCKGIVDSSLSTGEFINWNNILGRNFIIDILVASCDPNIKNDQGDALLHIACKSHVRSNSLKQLLANSVLDPNIQDSKGDTALHRLSRDQNFNRYFCDLLLAHAEINLTICNGHGNTALHEACIAYNDGCVERLINKDAVHVDVKNKKGRTALHIACSLFNPTIIPLFNCNKQDSSGDTILHIVAKSLRTKVKSKKDMNSYPKEVIEFLLDTSDDNLLLEKIDENAQNDYGDTLLHILSRRRDNDCDFVKKLLQRPGINVNIVNIEGDTPLHIACATGSTVAKLLLNHPDIRLDGVNNYGNTILHCTCMADKPEIVKMIIERKDIDLGIKNKCGDYVFDITYRKKDQTVHRLLAEHYPENYINWKKELAVRKCHLQESLTTNIDLLQCVSGFGELTLVDIHNLRYSSSYLTNLVNYRVVSDSIVPNMPFDLCSKIIIDAVHNNEPYIVEKFMRNNYEKRIESLKKILHLPEQYSIDDIMRVCRNAPAEKRFFWDSLLPLEYNKDQFLLNIISNFSNPNVVDCDGNTALHWACERGNDLLVQLLCKHTKTDLDIKNKEEKTPLDIACSQNNLDIIELLIKDPRIKCSLPREWCEEIFRKACKDIAGKDRPYKIMDILFATNPDFLNEWGHRPFMEACLAKNQFFMNVLCLQAVIDDFRLDLSKVYDDGTFLHWACLRPQSRELLEIVITLCWYSEHNLGLKKINYDAQDRLGNTALHLACKTGNIDLVRRLIHETRLNIVDCGGNTVLHAACMKDDNDAVVARLLEEKGINLNLKNDAGETPLHIACRKQDKKIVEILLKNCSAIDFSVQDDWGCTAFFIACEKGNKDIVCLFLRQPGFNVNMKMKNGNTGLSIASKKGHGDVVELLLNCKNNIHDKESLKKALVQSKDIKCIEKLLNYQLLKNNLEQDFYVDKMIFPALNNENIPLLMLLFQHKKIEQNHRHQDATILHVAIKKGLSGIVQKLLTKDIDVNEKDENGYTPLDKAYYEMNLNLRRMLREKKGSHSWRFYLERIMDPNFLNYQMREDVTWLPEIVIGSRAAICLLCAYFLYIFSTKSMSFFANQYS